MPTSFEGVMMQVPYRLLIGDPIDEAQIEKIQAIIFSTFSHIDKVYNNWNPSSEISLLSHLKAKEIVLLSSELQNFLENVQELYIKSEGRFDITCTPLSALWKKSKPSPETLSKITASIGWNKVHLEGSFFWKEHEETSFDLGGIAKGYAVDLLTENLIKEGFKNIYVEWGGEISVRGKHPANRLWKVGIQRKNIVLDLNNQSIATSGDDYQSWKIEDIEYFHIINPKTCTPLVKRPDSISSVTVIASSCMLADALATILMLFETSKEAESWLAKYYPEARCWII